MLDGIFCIEQGLNLNEPPFKQAQSRFEGAAARADDGELVDLVEVHRHAVVEIDDELVQKAMRLTGARTKREVVNIALRRLVDKGSLYRAVRRLRGKLAWEGNVDLWRSGRSTRG